MRPAHAPRHVRFKKGITRVRFKYTCELEVDEQEDGLVNHHGAILKVELNFDERLNSNDDGGATAKKLREARDILFD